MRHKNGVLALKVGEESLVVHPEELAQQLCFLEYFVDVGLRFLDACSDPPFHDLGDLSQSLNHDQMLLPRHVPQLALVDPERDHNPDLSDFVEGVGLLVKRALHRLPREEKAGIVEFEEPVGVEITGELEQGLLGDPVFGEVDIRGD